MLEIVSKRMDKRALLLYAFLTVGIAVPLLWPDQGSAKGVYVYKDHKGVVHFTDAPTEPRFRLVKIMADGGTVKRKMYQIDRSHLDKLITNAAQTYNLDPALIKAVIKAESAFDPRAVSFKGAKGLMQLMPATAREMNVTDAFNPTENIAGGSRYLRYLLDRYRGDVKLALAAYNMGPERIKESKSIPPIRETRLYLQRVMEYYQDYKK
jgi:soluble lytic murein transglycosylase-like protein